MPKFNTYIGYCNESVDVEYKINEDGNFESMFVIIYSPEPTDISKYLHHSQIDSLQYEAQMHHMEEAININESNMA